MFEGEFAHDVAISVETRLQFLEESVVLVGASHLCVCVEGGVGGEEGGVELAELIADSSEAEEDEAEDDDAKIGDSKGDPAQMHASPAAVELQRVGADYAQNQQQGGGQYESQNALD